jgi:hypothetical protein
MIKRDRSNLLKNLLVMGAAGAGLLVSVPALAQSDASGTSDAAPEEFQLSAEGFKILCENFPLNSRCQGGSGEQPSAAPETAPRESLNPGTSEPSMPDAPSLSPAPEAGDTTSPSYEPPTTEPSGGISPEKPGDSMSPTEPSGGIQVPQPSMPDAPKPQSLELPGATPKGERSGTTEAPAAPSAAPASSQAPSTTTPQSAPAEPTAPAPSAPGAAPSSGTPAAPAAEVSEAELQQFAKVIPELQEIQQSAQQQVSEAIQSAGLT